MFYEADCREYVKGFETFGMPPHSPMWLSGAEFTQSVEELAGANPSVEEPEPAAEPVTTTVDGKKPDKVFDIEDYFHLRALYRGNEVSQEDKKSYFVSQIKSMHNPDRHCSERMLNLASTSRILEESCRGPKSQWHRRRNHQGIPDQSGKILQEGRQEYRGLRCSCWRIIRGERDVRISEHFQSSTPPLLMYCSLPGLYCSITAKTV